MKKKKLKLLDGRTINLKHEHDAYAREVAMNPNYRAAYIKVYGSESIGPGPSASKLNEREDVQDAIEHYRTKLSNALDVSEAAIMAELAACGMARVTDLLNKDGTVKTPNEFEGYSHTALSSYKVKTQGTQDGDILETTIVMTNKIAALKTMAEIKGMGKINEQNNTKIVINNTI